MNPEGSDTGKYGIERLSSQEREQADYERIEEIILKLCEDLPPERIRLIASRLHFTAVAAEQIPDGNE